MNLLFVADALERFVTYKDSTLAMMREASARGHVLLACAQPAPQGGSRNSGAALRS